VDRSESDRYPQVEGRAMSVTLDYAIVGTIVRLLKANGSWCGETHIQKTAFVAKEIFGVPLSATFVLYKHGPFSFDLNGILGSMRADRVLALVPQGSYGPSFTSEPSMDFVFRKFEREINDLAQKIEQVAKYFGPKNVADLERVATAIFITLKRPADGVEIRASELNHRKPHIPMPVALSAVVEADQFLQTARNVENAA
jgi:hypothetical protein